MQTNLMLSEGLMFMFLQINPRIFIEVCFSSDILHEQTAETDDFQALERKIF
jgi:hypothetical protein